MQNKWKSTLWITSALVAGSLILTSCNDKKDDLTPLIAIALVQTKFTDNNNGTVSDVDGNMWQKCAYGQTWNSSLNDCTGDTTGGPTTYGAKSLYYCELADLCFDVTTQEANSGPAFNACDGLDLGGYTDWRLPTKYELALLASNVNYSTFAAAFPETPDDKPFWSGTNNSDSTGGTASAWGAWFSDGYFGKEVSRTKESSPLYVRCVRKP